MDLRCPPITPKAYRPYGAVIAGGFPGPSRSANMGTARGITYKPGVWHHPLIVLDRPADFACLIWEDGSAGDCQVTSLLAGAGALCNVRVRA